MEHARAPVRPVHSYDLNWTRKMRREEITIKQHVVPGSPAGSGRCLCLRLPSLFLSLALAAAVVLIVIFVLKPKRPTFHLHAVQLGSPEAPFDKGVNDSSAMVSLLFVAQNPNKFDIRFGSSELGLVYGSNMGLIKVPTFFQPAKSTNISVLVRVFFEVMDLGEAVNEMQSLSNSPEVEVRIFGAIKAWPHVFNFALPKIKVFLDCSISAKLSSVAISRALSTTKTHKALLFPNFPHLTQKCSLALCI